VLFPVLPVGAAPGQQPQCERAAQIAKFFGSQPRAAAAAGAVPAPLTLPATPPKKRKEGC